MATKLLLFSFFYYFSSQSSVNCVVARRRASNDVFNSSRAFLENEKEEEAASQLPLLVLPIWVTEKEELELMERAQLPVLRGAKSQKEWNRLHAAESSQPLLLKRVQQQQQQQQQQTVLPSFRIPAEYEPISTVIMAYDPRYIEMTSSMIRSIEQAGSHAWLLVPERANSQTVPPSLHGRHITANFDSIWTRDYGPITGIVVERLNATTTTTGKRSSGSSSTRRVAVDPVYRLGHVRPLDEQVPCQMVQHFQASTTVSCYSTSLVMDGGNLMFDGNGNLFTTKVTYVWNNHLTRQEVNQELKAVFGVDQIHAFDYAKSSATDDSDRAADGTGHLDMFVKILAPCVVLVAEARPSDQVYWAVLNKAATYFSTLHCQTHHDLNESSITTSFYQVYRVPGWEDRQRWYTYTNSLIVNDRVIVPSYDSAADNDIALAVYNTAAPHLTVDFVHSELAIQQGGAIHCLTRDIPRLPRPVMNATRASLRQKRGRQKIFHGARN